MWDFVGEAVILDWKYRKSDFLKGGTSFLVENVLSWLKIVQKVTIFKHGRVGGCVKVFKVRFYNTAEGLKSNFWAFFKLGLFKGGNEAMSKAS